MKTSIKNRKRKIFYYELGSLIAAFLIILFLFITIKDSTIVENPNPCWKDSANGEISKEINIIEVGNNQKYTSNIKILGEVNCTNIFGDDKCVKYTEKINKNAINLGQEVRIGPKKYIGSYLIFDDELFYLDELYDELIAVCEGGLEISIGVNEREFTLNKIKKKDYILNGNKIPCCLVRIEDKNDNFAEFCVSTDRCNTVFEIKQVQGNKNLNMKVIDYKI